MRHALLSLLFALSACSDGGGASSTPADATPPVDAAEPAPDACLDCPDGRVLTLADAGPEGDAAPPPEPMGLRPIEDNCADLYDQAFVPTFEVEIDPAEWAAIEDEFAHPAEREEAGLPLKPYHPLIQFKYGQEVVHDAMIRLKSNPFYSWVPPKMQFVISFRQHDRAGRFHGLRKISLDAPWYDPTLLRERVALSILREAGVPAGCANNAKLRVNGALYGVYVNREHHDKEFLERHFDDPEGNLYKYGRELKTNEAEGDVSRRDALWATTNLADFGALVDRQAAVTAWAAEAILPHLDGFWCCDHNYYLYDHPQRGFIFIPYDLDIVLDRGSPETSLLSYGGRRPPHLQMAMADQGWRTDFAEAVGRIHQVWDPDELERRVDVWSAQIGNAVRLDPSLPFTVEEHVTALAELRAFFRPRAEYVGEFVEVATACRRGDPGRDRDRDGTDECTDCDDLNREIHPGAVETCNERDDDCNGEVDDGLECGACTALDVGEQHFLLCAAGHTWFGGHMMCVRNGAVLAVPTADELPTVIEAAAALADEPWWLGANDGNYEGRWADPDGVALANPPWGPGAPDGGDDQNCALLSLDGTWSDADCSEPHPVICRLR
jgi:hypothetical protein